MRMMLGGVFVLSAISLPVVPAAQAGDLAPPVYGAGPPRGYVQVPPPAFYPPPTSSPYAYAPPPPYPARSVIVSPQGPAYVVPGYAYQPGQEYVEAPALVDGTRYYRQCSFEFGQRRCWLRHKAWFW